MGEGSGGARGVGHVTTLSLYLFLTTSCFSNRNDYVSVSDRLGRLCLCLCLCLVSVSDWLCLSSQALQSMPWAFRPTTALQIL